MQRRGTIFIIWVCKLFELKRRIHFVFSKLENKSGLYAYLSYFVCLSFSLKQLYEMSQNRKKNERQFFDYRTTVVNERLIKGLSHFCMSQTSFLCFSDPDNTVPSTDSEIDINYRSPTNRLPARKWARQFVLLQNEQNLK